MRTTSPAAALLAIPLLSPPYVHATPTDDLINLQFSIANATNALTLSLNTTADLNTSAMIQNIGYQVGASMANLGCANSSQPSSNATNDTDISTGNLALLEAAYQNYALSLPTFSAALTARGRSPHAEFDYPVQATIQSLARAIYNYGKCLRNGLYISAQSAILTWTAGSEVVQAETAWETWDDLVPAGQGGAREARRARRESVRGGEVARTGG